MTKQAAPERSSPPVVVALSIEDAVRASGISRTQLYEKMKAGRLASKKIGRRRIVPVKDLEAWMAAAQAA